MLYGQATTNPYGLATAPQAAAARALDRIDSSVGPVIFLCMLAGPLALILLVGAAARAGYASRWLIAGAVLFAVVDSLPVLAAEVIQGVVGITTFAVLALRLLALASAGVQPVPARARSLATAV